MNSSQNSTGGGKRRRSVWARRLNILGIVLIFGALVVVSMRSFVVESFNDARHKSFMAPAGKMFAPDAGHFYFAAVSDTGARKANWSAVFRTMSSGAAIIRSGSTALLPNV